MRGLLILFLLISACSAIASQHADISFSAPSNSIIYTDSFIELDNTVVAPKHQKLKAVLLAVFLGHFGVHRIYLGTAPNVPVVYSLTLGGGLGLLPLLDIIAILDAEDLDKFSNNDQVFMWSEKKND